MACHFESCPRTTPTSTMAMFVLPKWAKFSNITRHCKLYQDFHGRTLLFTSESVIDPTQQEVVAPTLWPTQLWLVDADCNFYDSAMTTSSVEPPSLRVPQEESTTFIAATIFFGRYHPFNWSHGSSTFDSNRVEHENFLWRTYNFRISQLRCDAWLRVIWLRTPLFFTNL
jgi:hypothetical protein